jgi:CDP-6-deoxy-D-xylo-4-hexulose-3-dehydrase
LRAALADIGRSEIKLIEDACDTVTTSIADFATISFYTSHVISAGGCGGMLLTNDEELHRRSVELMSSGAWDLSAPSFCAVFGLANVEKFEEFAAARNRNFLHYCERLKDSGFYQVPESTNSLWLSMPLLCKSHRFEIIEELEKRQIQTRLCLAGNILRQPFYATLFPDEDPEAFPETEKVFKGGILVGLHQGISHDDVDWICDQLLEIAATFHE